MFAYLANTLTVLLQSGVFLLACYYLGIAVFSLFPSRNRKYKDEKLRFAVVIPAHNEAQALPGLLRSLAEQTYPKELFSVFVMADRCTDRTREVAMAYHTTPLLRKTADYSGKGAALKDAFSQLMALPESFDAFVVLDADNLADPGFLEEINQIMQQGNPAVQGYIDSKNPNESWLSHAYSIWYWISNRTNQMGFDRLGLGCKLGGTGFALSRRLLEEIPWETTTMAEDAEYTLRLALKNHTIAYAPKAVVYDEKPTSFSTSVQQRIRWTQGITQVQRDFSGVLLRKGKIHAFLRFWSDLLTPLCVILFLILDVFSVTNLLELTAVPFVRLWTKPLPFLLLNFYLLGTVFTILRGLLLDKKWNKKLVLNLFGFLLYFTSWIPAGLIGIFRHRNKEWYHTEHKSAV